MCIGRDDIRFGRLHRCCEKLLRPLQNKQVHASEVAENFGHFGE